jgi:hypothetical protein
MEKDNHLVYPSENSEDSRFIGQDDLNKLKKKINRIEGKFIEFLSGFYIFTSS